MRVPSKGMPRNKLIAGPRATISDTASATHTARKPQVLVVGGGWAGLGAAWHLCKQGYGVNVLEASPHVGGLVAGWNDSGRNVEVGVHGFWYPYFNIFKLVDELALDPFTPWTPSNQYSPHGLEVQSKVFQMQPRLPTPLGHFVYSDFARLPVTDRLTALPMVAPSADFDHSPDAWRRYDSMTARELFREARVSQRLYDDAFNAMLLVGLFACGERCSAAAALGMLNFFILSHQQDFDVKWCRGTTADTIFSPWVRQMVDRYGARVSPQHRVVDVRLDAESGRVTSVIADTPDGRKELQADAVVFAVGISGMQKIVPSSDVLSKRDEFRRVMNLNAVDVMGVRLWLDRLVRVPRPSNACAGFDAATGWTFFDLNALHDEFKDAPCTVLEADFYGASELLPMSDDAIVQKVMRDVTTCVPRFGGARVTDAVVVRFPRSVTHFTPGSYEHFLRPTTSFPNVFAAGDWVANTHGSFSQEKAYVTGLEAANNVIDLLGMGMKASIRPLEPVEDHIAVLRSALQLGRELSKLSPFAGLLPTLLR